MFCKSCGAELKDGSKFCPYCGADQGVEPTVVVTPPEPEPWTQPMPAPEPTPGPAPQPTPAPTPTPQPGPTSAPKKRGKAPLIVAGVLGVIVLVVVAFGLVTCMGSGGQPTWKPSDGGSSQDEPADKPTQHELVITFVDGGYGFDKGSPIPVRVKGKTAAGESVDKTLYLKESGQGLPIEEGTYTLRTEASPFCSDGRVFKTDEDAGDDGTDIRVDENGVSLGTMYLKLEVVEAKDMTQDMIDRAYKAAVESVGKDRADELRKAAMELMEAAQKTAQQEKKKEEEQKRKAQEQEKKKAKPATRATYSCDNFSLQLPASWGEDYTVEKIATETRTGMKGSNGKPGVSNWAYVFTKGDGSQKFRVELKAFNMGTPPSGALNPGGDEAVNQAYFMVPMTSVDDFKAVAESWDLKHNAAMFDAE